MFSPENLYASLSGELLNYYALAVSVSDSFNIYKDIYRKELSMKGSGVGEGL